jgi:hypothetical protein
MSGWETFTKRRWRLYPTWMPFGTKSYTTYVSGGDFVYRD